MLFASRTRFTVVLLAMAINMISYMDRVCIAVAAPKLRDEFGLTPSQTGMVFSIFSLAYFLGQTPWGILADRFGARGIVSLAVFWWSAFTALTAAAWGFVSLLVIRFLFGAVEAALSPAIASGFTRWIPAAERSTAFGVFLSGGRIGGAIVPPVAALLLVQFGWRTMFLSFAALGLAGALAWYLWYRNEPEQHPRVTPAELARIRQGRAETEKAPVAWSLLLSSPPLLCLLAVAFGFTVMWQFFATWFPTYLTEKRGLNLAEAATFAGLPFLFGVASNWIGGLLADLLARRYDPALGRTMVGFTALLLAGLLMAAGIWYPHARVAALLMALSAFAGDLFLGAAWSSAVVIGGRAGGAVAGLMNSASNLGGFVSPMLIGWMLERTGDWNTALSVGVVTTLISAFLWLRVNPRGPALELKHA